MREQTMNPWIAIWRQPRQAIRYVLTMEPTAKALMLGAASGVLNALGRAASQGTGETMGFLPLMLLCVIGGALMGILGMAIFTALIRWMGRWLGGRASYDEVLVTMGWSAVPTLWAGLLWIPSLLLFGEQQFKNEPSFFGQDAALTIMYFVFALIELVAGIWSFFVFLACLSEVQGFSKWKAFFNTSLPGICLVGVILIIASLAAAL